MTKTSGELLVSTPVFNFTGTVQSAHELIEALVERYKDRGWPMSERMKRTIEILKARSHYMEPVRTSEPKEETKMDKISDFTKEVVEKSGIALEDAVKMLA